MSHWLPRWKVIISAVQKSLLYSRDELDTRLEIPPAVTIWLGGDVLVAISVVVVRRARLILRWLPIERTYAPSRCETHLGHPAMDGCNEYSESCVVTFIVPTVCFISPTALLASADAIFPVDQAVSCWCDQPCFAFDSLVDATTPRCCFRNVVTLFKIFEIAVDYRRLSSVITTKLNCHGYAYFWMRCHFLGTLYICYKLHIRLSDHPWW